MKRILVLAAVLLIVAAIFGGMFLYNRPLGQALELQVPDELAAPPAPVRQDDSPGGNAKKTCGDTGRTRLLTLGQASPMETGHYGADAIRLVWVDFDAPAVAALALPADLWADADAIDDPAVPDLPLNEIYQVAYDTASGNKPEVRTRKATQELAQALVDIYGYVPDHYLTLQEEAFVELVDLSPVEVNVPYDILIVPEGWHTFEAGLQTLYGEQALDYVRIYMPDLDVPYSTIWARFERQDQVLWALLDNALNIENWDDIPEMVKLARKMVVTDLSVNQADNLACMLKEAGDQIDLYQIDPDDVSEDGQGNLLVDPQVVRDIITEIETGLDGE